MLAQQLPLFILILISAILTARFCRNILTATDVDSWQYEALVTIKNLYQSPKGATPSLGLSQALCFTMAAVIVFFCVLFSWYLIAAAVALQGAVVYHFIGAFRTAK